MALGGSVSAGMGHLPGLNNTDLNTVQGLDRLLTRYRPSSTAVDLDHTPAAVLVLLVPGKDGLCVLLTKRTSHVEHHKGEICFPGGVKESDDSSLKETALRETTEELGVLPSQVTILGPLDTVTTRTRFSLSPFLGLIVSPYSFSPNPEEVEAVLEVPLTLLLDTRSRREEAFLTSDGIGRRYAYAYKDHLVFGATARILTNVLDLLGEIPERSS